MQGRARRAAACSGGWGRGWGAGVGREEALSQASADSGARTKDAGRATMAR